MKIEDIKLGELVTCKGTLTEPLAGMTIPPGTPGIVTKLFRGYEHLHVEFELGNSITTAPVTCYANQLNAL